MKNLEFRIRHYLVQSLNKKHSFQFRKLYSITDRIHSGRSSDHQHRLGQSPMRANGTERQTPPMPSPEQRRRNIHSPIRTERSGPIPLRRNLRKRARTRQHIQNTSYTRLRPAPSQSIRPGPRRRHNQLAMPVHGRNKRLRPRQLKPGCRRPKRGQNDLQREPKRNLHHGVFAR